MYDRHKVVETMWVRCRCLQSWAMHEFMEISMLSSLMSWQRFFLPVQQQQQQVWVPVGCWISMSLQLIRSNRVLSIRKTSSWSERQMFYELYILGVVWFTGLWHCSASNIRRELAQIWIPNQIIHLHDRMMILSDMDEAHHQDCYQADKDGKVSSEKNQGLDVTGWWWSEP